MHLSYSFCDGNATAASKEHQNQNPDHRQPIRHVCYGVLQSEGNRCIHVTADTMCRMKLSDRYMQIHWVTYKTHLSECSVAYTAWKNCCILFICSLHRDYSQGTISFCSQSYLRLLQNRTWTHFLHCVLWTDEGTFTRGGVNHLHNPDELALEILHATQTSSFRQKCNINVWAGIVESYLTES